MTCSRSRSPIVNATVSAMAPLWPRGGHFYFGETGHLHFGPTGQRLIRYVMSTFGVVTHFRSFGDLEAPCGRLHGAWHGCCVRAKRTPVRIALFCPSYGQVGGIEEKARVLIEAFRAQGHAVTVLARGEPATSGSDGDVPVVRREYHQMPRRARHVARQLRFLRDLPRGGLPAPARGVRGGARARGRASARRHTERGRAGGLPGGAGLPASAPLRGRGWSARPSEGLRRAPRGVRTPGRARGGPPDRG